MIGFLRGQILDLTADVVLLDVGGVGYEVQISAATWRQLSSGKSPAEGGGPAALYIHTHAREDSLSLFGFSSPAEKGLFERLIGVSGVGPKLARTILSGGELAVLVGAIAGGDIARLQKVPGVGKKTAQRIVLELKDKVQDLAITAVASSAGSPVEHDVVSALTNLGYRAADAESAVAAARVESPEAPFDELVRKSLARLARV